MVVHYKLLVAICSELQARGLVQLRKVISTELTRDYWFSLLLCFHLFKVFYIGMYCS